MVCRYFKSAIPRKVYGHIKAAHSVEYEKFKDNQRIGRLISKASFERGSLDEVGERV
jgi:hypothetical protein